MFVSELETTIAAEHILDIVDISRLDIFVLCLRFYMIDLPSYSEILSAHNISLDSILTTNQPSGWSGAMVHGAALGVSVRTSSYFFLLAVNYLYHVS